MTLPSIAHKYPFLCRIFSKLANPERGIHIRNVRFTRFAYDFCVYSIYLHYQVLLTVVKQLITSNSISATMTTLVAYMLFVKVLSRNLYF